MGPQGESPHKPDGGWAKSRKASQRRGALGLSLEGRGSKERQGRARDFKSQQGV